MSLQHDSKGEVKLLGHRRSWVVMGEEEVADSPAALPNHEVAWSCCRGLPLHLCRPTPFYSPVDNIMGVTAVRQLYVYSWLK